MVITPQQVCVVGSLNMDLVVKAPRLPRVGEDAFGRQFVDGLKRDRIDVAHVRVDAGAGTGAVFIGVDGEGGNMIRVASGANMRVAPADADEARDNKSTHLLRVRHPGYDIRGAQRDHNVVFPIDHPKALEVEGVIGQLADERFRVGARTQRSSKKRLARKLKRVEHDQLFRAQVDYTFLTSGVESQSEHDAGPF